MPTDQWLSIYSTMSNKALFEIMADPSSTADQVVAAKYELGARGALEASEPPEPVSLPARAGSPSSSGVDTSDVLGCLLIPGVIVAWLLYVLAYAPAHPTKRQEIPEKCTIYVELMTNFPGSWPRVELMEAGNVNVYMTRSTFEAVPFPDRAPAVKRVGVTWDSYSSWYNLSSVRIRDVRTGEDLATYSCNTGRVTLEKKGWF